MSNYSFEHIKNLVTELRSPRGCPWHRLQTPKSIQKYLLEESQEVFSAIDEKNPAHLCEELADLLLQILILSQMASEEGQFTIDNVLNCLASKLVRRHPHVFTQPQNLSLDEVASLWRKIKNQEKISSVEQSSLAKRAPGQPGLDRAKRILEQAALEGFDWPNWQMIAEKISEELDEVRDAHAKQDNDHLEDEIGDLLLACTNLSRKLLIDPTLALERATRKFTARYDSMISLIDSSNPPQNLADWILLWKNAKKQVFDSSKNTTSDLSQGCSISQQSSP